MARGIGHPRELKMRRLGRIVLSTTCAHFRKNLIPFSDSPVPARINKLLTAAEELNDECRAAWIGLLPADAVDNLQPARFVPGMRAYQPWTPRRRNPIHRALFELVRRQPQNLIHLDGIPVTHRAILRGPVEPSIPPEEIAGGTAVSHGAGYRARRMQMPGAIQPVRPEKERFHEWRRGRREKLPP